MSMGLAGNRHFPHTMASREVGVLLSSRPSTPGRGRAPDGRPLRYAVVHTALGRIGGAEGQLVRFIKAARESGEDVDLFYNGLSFPEVEALGNQMHLPTGSSLARTAVAYVRLLRRLKEYDSIVIYHHVEPVLLGLIAGLHGDRCVAYVGEPLRPLWENEVSGDPSLISYPEMRNTAHQLYGPGVAELLHHPWMMEGIVRTLRAWDRWTHQRVRDLLANSQFTAEIMQRVYRLARRPQVVYQGIPTAFGRSERSRRDRLVLSVGAFIPLKDQATLLKAWRWVEARFGGECPRLVLIGDGVMHDESVRLARRLELEHVEFIPHVSEEDLRHWYARATLLVHTAIGEPFGMTPVEAAAHRVPSIVSNLGGTPEFVIDGTCGRVFPARDAHKLADTLIELLADPAKCDALGREALQRQRSAFTIGHTVSSLLARGANAAADYASFSFEGGPVPAAP